MAQPINFNPFRGYSNPEKDVRDPRVREQIKDIAQLEGAIIIRRDGVAVAAAMYLTAPVEGITLSKGLGTRHGAAAAITRKTKAVAVAVSQAIHATRRSSSSSEDRSTHDGRSPSPSPSVTPSVTWSPHPRGPGVTSATGAEQGTTTRARAPASDRCADRGTGLLE